MSERELVSLRESDETSWIERDYEATSNAVQALAAATAHVAAGDLDNASKALDTAAAAHPEDWGARVLIHALRGVVAANQGDREKAERRLAKAQELAERSAQPARWSDYQEAAAQARLALGDLDQAQRHAFEADQLKVHPIERQDLAVLAGEIAEAAGKRSDAIRHYEQAVAFGIDTKRHRDAEAGLARLRG